MWFRARVSVESACAVTLHLQVSSLTMPGVCIEHSLRVLDTRHSPHGALYNPPVCWTLPLCVPSTCCVSASHGTQENEANES